MKKIFLILLTFTLFPCAAKAVIEKQDIGDINPETSGVTHSNQISIPVDLWKGLSHKQVVQLIKGLPSRFQTPFWANIQIALLTTPMKIPEGVSDDKDNILNLRFEKLMEMEAFDPAYNLGKQHPDQLNQDAWAWCRLMRFIIHNNYDKAFKIAQENAVKDLHNKWQYAVIVLQILKGKKNEAKFSLALLEKENEKQDQPFIKAIKKILGNKTVEIGTGLEKPLIMKLLLSKKDVPEKIQVEALSFGMIDLMINDRGFESFSDRMQLSILEYYVEQDHTKAEVLKKKYIQVAPEDRLEEFLKKLEDNEDVDENDPLSRALLYKVFKEAEDEEIQKRAFYAYYMNAYKHKILPVAAACFGVDYNFPASREDAHYAGAFLLHNVMLKNPSYVQAWMAGLNEDELSELALLILLSFDADTLSKRTLETLQNTLVYSKQDPAHTFLYQQKLKFIPNYRGYALKLQDHRLLDVIGGHYGFGEAMQIILKAAGPIAETDVWQSGVLVRALDAIGLKNQANQLVRFYAYSTPKGD